MINIETVKDGNRCRYVRIDTDEKCHVVLRRECELHVVQCLQDQHNVFSLLDEDGNTYSLFSKYINKIMLEDHRSVNSRRKYAQVLCKFYSFINLMGYSEYALGYDEICQLRTFFQGSSLGQCKNETVNAYLSIIRDFFTKMDIGCEVLFRRHIAVSNDVGNDFRVGSPYYAYDMNFPGNPHKQDRAPKYISMEQYVRLIELARADGDWNGIILMHLMFRYGMRLGECLGLTEEDFTNYYIKGVAVPTLIVRNRLTDCPWQQAKRKFIPCQKSDYQGETYIEQWRDDDYSHYYLTESGDFVLAFTKFMQETKIRAELNYAKNYCSCEADIVDPLNFHGEKNHYIFVNRIGKRLSAQLWGITLKKYFVQAGIPLDSGKKDKNLSHRFRHGFAMMHARFMDPPVPAHELQKMMHHHNLSSTMIYYNPTAEDEYEYKTRMQNNFYDNNPRLNIILEQYLHE